jgi:hypothetical protein
MVLLPEAAGPHDPATTTPSRLPGSIRRTSSIDTSRPDGIGGDMVMVARARDLRTDGGGIGTEVARVELELRLDGMTRTIVSITGAPDLRGLDALVGLTVGPGFRGRVDQALPGEQDTGSLLYLLLDDLPGAALVSGYALQRAGVFDTPILPAGAEESVGAEASRDADRPPVGERRPVTLSMAQLPAVDLCAGWASDSAMMVSIGATGVVPTPMGPPAPVLEAAGDPLGWHAMGPLAPHAMRRRRRLDVVAVAAPDADTRGRPGADGGPDADGSVSHRLDVHFRDSHVDSEGLETVVHEYSVSGAVDSVAGRVVEVSARANVLPWTECPGALASAGRLVGMPMVDLRPRVRRELVGTSSCTHLNDTLRSLSDVTLLVSELAGDGIPVPEPERGTGA